MIFARKAADISSAPYRLHAAALGADGDPEADLGLPRAQLEAGLGVARRVHTPVELL